MCRKSICKRIVFPFQKYFRTIISSERHLKGFSKTDFMKETDPLNTIKDPIEFQYDITYEEKYLRNLLDKLQLLSSLKPDTDYISIFYERYIEKLSRDEICKNHKLTELQLNEKILEMVRFINKDN